MSRHDDRRLHSPGDRATVTEARDYLQRRLALLFQLMFWSLVALVAFVWVQYVTYPEHAPVHRNIVYAGSFVGLAAMAFVWRGLLVRRELGVEVLYRIDAAYSLGVGAAFGASAALQSDLRPAGYMALVYSAFTVFARALIVPSSARRTAVASSLTFLPMTGAALYLALKTTQEMPRPAYFTGYLMLSIVAIALSTAGSHIIYGLRREVSAAQQLGQYTLDRKIGEGGMGAVYRAHHIMLRAADRGEAAAPRSGRQRQPRAVRARSAAHEPADASEHRRGVRLRAQPGRRLLLRDGVPRRRRRLAEARPAPRPAAVRARRAHPRASLRRAPGGARSRASSIATSSRRTSSCASAAACPTSRRSSTSAWSRRSAPTRPRPRARSCSARPPTSRRRRSPIQTASAPRPTSTRSAASGSSCSRAGSCSMARAPSSCARSTSRRPPRRRRGSPPACRPSSTRSSCAASRSSPPIASSLRPRSRPRCARCRPTPRGATPARASGGADLRRDEQHAASESILPTKTITVDLGYLDSAS